MKRRKKEVRKKRVKKKRRNLKSLVMKASFHKLLPWLLSLGWCIAFVLFVQLSISMTGESDVERWNSAKVIEKQGSLYLAGTEMPGPTSVSDTLISRLAFSPEADLKEMPLVASIIENHQDARPHQKGLRDAVMVFEFIVEGDITRFMAFFREDRLPSVIGPVRSLREYMVSVALGYKPLLLHAGGHRFAYDALKANPNLIHHDGIRYDGETYERDEKIDPPHNLFMRKATLASVIEKHNIKAFDLPLFPSATNYKLLSVVAPERSGGAKAEQTTNSKNAKKININMGSPTHDVKIIYKPFRKLYIRSVAHAARQAQPKTVAILEAYVDGFNQAGYIPWTKTFDGGKMLLFRDGKVIEGRWEREKGEPFRFYDSGGNPLGVAKEQVWVTMLPSLGMVSWE